jgi:rubrerythrin
MNTERDTLKGIFCTAIELKDKKVELYAKAMKGCGDEVGIQTFKALKEAEEAHLTRFRQMYEDLTQGKAAIDSCKYYDFGGADKKTILRKIARELGKIAKACVNDVVAIEQGMELEDKSISLFTEELKRATDPLEREFLNYMIAEEREHYILLTDLRFYYVDSENWFLEKSKSGLDGAGAFA